MMVKLGALGRSHGVDVKTGYTSTGIAGEIFKENDSRFTLRVCRFDRKEWQRYSVAFGLSLRLLNPHLIETTKQGIQYDALYQLSDGDWRLRKKAIKMASEILLPEKDFNEEAKNFEPTTKEGINKLASKFMVPAGLVMKRLGISSSDLKEA